MVQLSQVAAEKIRVLIDEQKLSEKGGLRIYANSGCCSNSSFGMALDPNPNPEDNIFESQGIRVLIDPASFGQLEGASVEYYKDEHAEGFTINKPHTHSDCGCGGSCNC